MTTPTTSTETGGKRRGWRRIAVVTVVVVLVLALVAYLYASSVVYDQISLTHAKCGGRFTQNTPAAYTATPDKHEDKPVDTSPYLMPDYETVTFPSRDPAITISAWYVPGAGANATSAVVLVHGHDSCKREDAMLLAAGMLHKDGIGVLLIDMRNHGDSTVPNGRFAGGTNEYRDALAGYDWLVNTHGYAPNRVGLLGMSLGAATVLIATGEEPKVAAVWSDSSYADIDVAIAGELERNDRPTWLRYGGYLMARIRSGDDLQSLSPLGAMAKLHGRPIFIVHGTADTRVKPVWAGDLAAAVRANGGTVEPWMVEGSEHTRSILDQPAEYERRLDAFFETALAGK